jgi:hypothetical protein
MRAFVDENTSNQQADDLMAEMEKLDTKDLKMLVERAPSRGPAQEGSLLWRTRWLQHKILEDMAEQKALAKGTSSLLVTRNDASAADCTTAAEMARSLSNNTTEAESGMGAETHNILMNERSKMNLTPAQRWARPHPTTARRRARGGLMNILTPGQMLSTLASTSRRGHP